MKLLMRVDWLTGGDCSALLPILCLVLLKNLVHAGVNADKCKTIGNDFPLTAADLLHTVYTILGPGCLCWF